MAHSGQYPKPRNSASPPDACHAGSCECEANEAETCRKDWHEFDTRGSLSVHARPSAQTETAVPAGPRNGGKKVSQESSAFEEKPYQKVVPAATVAATWYAENRRTCPRPIVPTLCAKFGLTVVEAVQAIKAVSGARS